MQYNYPNFSNTIRSFLRKLYTPAKEYHQRKLKDIVLENNHKQGQGESFGGIIFQGKTYYYLGSMHKQHEVNSYVIHEDLFTSMQVWLAELRDLNQEEREISRFLGRFFSVVCTYTEAKELLGENIIQMLDMTPRTFNFYVELSPEELTQYAMEFKPYIEIIQNRIMDNLITRTLYDSEN
jgi:hypothetical protein